MKILIIQCLIMSCIFSCMAQEFKEMKQENNPMLCDPEKGICEIPGMEPNEVDDSVKVEGKRVKIIYFTDPICSSCWGIEPQLRKLKLEYGHEIEIEYRMGGLLPDWSYNSGGISKPSDVAHHWDEVSAYYQMPIDGDVWLEDPLNSSYPPSIAFKAAQIQDQAKAVEFLRLIREYVFLEKKNITRWEHLKQAAEIVGLDTSLMKKDLEQSATELFKEDLQLARKMGVRGFPTLFISDSSGQTNSIYGFNNYETFEKAILKADKELIKFNYSKDASAVFGKFFSLTLREFEELTGMDKYHAQEALDKLVKEGFLTVFHTKNGDLWKRTN